MRAAATVALPRAGAALLLAAAALLAGCAHRSSEVRPVPVDEASFRDWSCVRLHDELDAVQYRAADLAYAVDELSGNNIIALGVGLTVFWPALLAMQPDGPEARQLAELRGRDDTLRRVLKARDCGEPPQTMDQARAAALPVAVGDRLVYDDRNGPALRRPRPLAPEGVAAARTHNLVLRLVALRRNQLDFAVERDGQPLPGTWSQDLAGNAVAGDDAPLLRWRRLLRPDLALGQIVGGELLSADGGVRSARMRGQVVAIGPQVFSGRSFDVAVIELYGDVRRDPGDEGNARVDGVMAVDRRSGILLRLDLNSPNPAFNLRRRLLRVEQAAP